MKRERKSRNLNLKLYDELEANYAYSDSRYWGLFYCGKDGKVRIDIKRFLKMTHAVLTEKQLQIINKRKTHYFYPKKTTWAEYSCNVFERTMTEIEVDWLGDAVDKLRSMTGPHFDAEQWNKAVEELNSGKGGFKWFIAQAVQSIEKPTELTVGDDYNFLSGILDYDEAELNVGMTNMFRRSAYLAKCNKFIISMYAQFFHQMMSKIEAVQIEVLQNNKIDVKDFNRNVLKSIGAENNVDIEKLEHYKDYDLGYCVWHFLKHNSLSTYQKLKERYPEVLYDGYYRGGQLAYTYIKFDGGKLIEKVCVGCAEFFRELCAAIWDEDEEEARWNFDDYFEAIVNDEIETIDNPLGLPPWI